VCRQKQLKPLFFAIILIVLFVPLSIFGQTDSTKQQKEAIDKSMPLKERDSTANVKNPDKQVDKTMTSKKNNAEQDTADRKKKEHSPRKATYYSMALPGLGQAYNKKYWKIPVIYAGFGTLTYFIIDNNKEYNKYLDAFTYVLEDHEGPPPNAMVERYNGNLDKLRTIKDYYRRNLELSYILSGALYILQILDATVDAHFVDFDISEDISLQIRPYVEPDRNKAAFAARGITLRLKL